MKQKLTYQFFYQCTPEDPNSELQAEDIVLTVKDLPFFPQKDMVLRLTENMEYACVQDVFWSFDTPNLLLVYLEEPKFLADFDVMLIDGWRMPDHAA